MCFHSGLASKTNQERDIEEEPLESNAYSVYSDQVGLWWKNTAQEVH